MSRDLLNPTVARFSLRRPLAVVLLAVVSVGALRPRGAAAAGVESFNYPVGPLSGANGGSGFATPWVAYNDSVAPFAGRVVAGSLSDPTGLLATSGNHVEGQNLTVPSRRMAGTFGTPGQELWVGYLARRDAVEPGWSGLGLRRVTSGGSWEGAAPFIGEPGSGPADGTWGVGRAVDDRTFVSSGVPIRPGETVFLVTRMRFTAGPDSMTLFVNPTPGVEPTGGVTFNPTDFEFAPFTNPTLLLEGANNGTNPVTYAFDEIRFGATYAEVAPVVPEPSAALSALALAAIAAMKRRRREAPH